MTRNVLILGASYGSLLATRLLLAGHDVTLVCTRSTATLIEREGTIVAFPVKGVDGLVEVSSRRLPGRLHARTPAEVDPAVYDLVVLGMQEAQYGADGVRDLMARIAANRKPCLAIMNMPPLPYLARIGGLAGRQLEDCYTDASVWEGFDPAQVTLASPDPQAFRPADRPKNVLQVGLPTNFKAARFESDAHTALLRELAATIDASRYRHEGLEIELPVRLRVHDSLFVPLAKWPMLMTGNYRCVRPEGMVPIRDAVHGDLAESAGVYEWVAALCRRLGADAADLVPFEKYAAAAAGLGKPSSAARALDSGATEIERVDALVRMIARHAGEASATVDRIVDRVDARLRINRAAVRESMVQRNLAVDAGLPSLLDDIPPMPSSGAVLIQR